MSPARIPEEAGRHGVEARPLQPDEDLVTCSAQLVARIERVEPAVHQANLERDAATLLQLQLEGFAGRAWNQLERDLVGYAAQRVLPAKVRTGEIFVMMRELGIPPAKDLCLPLGPALATEDIEDIVQEVVVISLPRFKQSLKDGAWDPAREHVATLRTYFIGKCALGFRTPWRRFLRARNRNLKAQHRLERLHGLLDKRPTDPEVVAALRVDAARALVSLDDERLRRIIVLDAWGLTDPEIADATGTTTKSVEYQLDKARKRLRNCRELAEGVA